jgi:hypothetical protein
MLGVYNTHTHTHTHTRNSLSCRPIMQLSFCYMWALRADSPFGLSSNKKCTVRPKVKQVFICICTKYSRFRCCPHPRLTVPFRGEKNRLVPTPRRGSVCRLANCWVCFLLLDSEPKSSEIVFCFHFLLLWDSLLYKVHPSFLKLVAFLRLYSKHCTKKQLVLFATQA